MMRRLNLYLFRQLATAFLFAAVTVTFVILFTQSFRLLSLVINNSATLMIFMQLMALTVPTVLPLVLPLSIGVGVLFVYHKLAVDSELVIMRAAGISPMHLARPAFALAGIVMVVCYALTLFISPAANRTLVELQYKVRDSYAVFLSRPGNFNDITEGLTFYARKRGSHGELEGILIHDVRQPQTPVTIMADTGQVVDSETQPQIVIFNGRRQEMDVTTGRLSELAFDQYVLDLNALRSTQTHRLPDPREQTIFELLNPTQEMISRRASPGHLMAEIHQRLAAPLLVFSYTLIGLAAILAGEFNRRGMGQRILIASLIIITVEATFMSLVSGIAQHEWLIPVFYLTASIFIPIGLVLLGGVYLRPRPAELSADPTP
jgi:lipopolysaccharide export system permease protein